MKPVINKVGRASVAETVARLIGEVEARGMKLFTTIDHSGEAEAIFARLTLHQAIASLPDPLRTVFVLREIEDYSHNEISQLLGIRRGTSEVRLYRAIRLLRELLRSER